MTNAMTDLELEAEMKRKRRAPFREALHRWYAAYYAYTTATQRFVYIERLEADLAEIGWTQHQAHEAFARASRGISVFDANLLGYETWCENGHRLTETAIRLCDKADESAP